MMVVDKQEKKAEVVVVEIPSDSDIRKKEHKKLNKYQGLKKEIAEVLESQSIDCPSGQWSTWCFNPRTGRVAPTDLIGTIRDQRSLFRRAESWEQVRY